MRIRLAGGIENGKIVDIPICFKVYSPIDTSKDKTRCRLIVSESDKEKNVDANDDAKIMLSSAFSHLSQKYEITRVEGDMIVATPL